MSLPLYCCGEGVSLEPAHSPNSQSGSTTNEKDSSPESLAPHLETLRLSSDAHSSSRSSSGERSSNTRDSAPNTTEFVKVVRDVNYWPKIREVIERGGVDDDGSRVKLWLDCTICKSAMMRFPTPRFPVRGEHAPMLRDKLTVLFCGHMFHYTCMQAWIQACRTVTSNRSTAVGAVQAGGCVPNCPSCRESLVYEGCGHAMNLKFVSPSPPEDIEARIPHVRDEGGRKPGRCADCQLAEINKTVERMVQLICEPGDKDSRSKREQMNWIEECEEQIQTMVAIKQLQCAKRSTRW